MTTEATRDLIRKAARAMAQRRANLAMFDRDLPPRPYASLSADMVGKRARRIEIRL